MQSDDEIQKLAHSPALQKLIRKRVVMISILSTIMMLISAVYFIAIAYLPEWMGSTLYQQSTVSIGIWFSIFCVVFSVVISGFYIWWANNYYDTEMQKLIQEFSNTNE
jgi:uncharacterized membrane protein (DUF485 family)